MDKKPIRRPLSGGDLGKPPDQHVISHLPPTVTMRRPQSPTRRLHEPSSARLSSQSDELESGQISHGVSTNKFFRASEAQQAAKTPTTVPKKPAFFTASSFSSAPKTTYSTPDLRRTESANEVRTRSNSRPLARRTPSVRNPSPSRPTMGSFRSRPPTVPRLAASSSLDSPSPAVNVRQMDLSQDDEDTPSKTTTQAQPRLHRQQSTMSLRAEDPVSRQLVEAVPVIKSPAKEKTLRPQKRTSDSAISAGSTLDGADASDYNAQSPHSIASSATSTSYPQIETVESQPAQTNRKIMDLEIRTTSLLAVNNQLERQSRKQAAELKDLRKQLAHAMKAPSSTDNHLISKDALLSDADESFESPELTGDDDLQQVGTSLLRAASLVDHSIKRALLISEQLLKDANRGLHYRPRESEIGFGVLRVLQNSTPDITCEIDDSQVHPRLVVGNENGQVDYCPGNILDDADISELDAMGERA